MAKTQTPLLSVETEFKDKKLESLADKYADLRDEKAKLAEEMTALEGKVIERMQEIKFSTVRYADRLITIKQGKAHIKIKTVTNDGADEDGE